MAIGPCSGQAEQFARAMANYLKTIEDIHKQQAAMGSPIGIPQNEAYLMAVMALQDMNLPTDLEALEIMLEARNRMM